MIPPWDTVQYLRWNELCGISLEAEYRKSLWYSHLKGKILHRKTTYVSNTFSSETRRNIVAKFKLNISHLRLWEFILQLLRIMKAISWLSDAKPVDYLDIHEKFWYRLISKVPLSFKKTWRCHRFNFSLFYNYSLHMRYLTLFLDWNISSEYLFLFEQCNSLLVSIWWPQTLHIHQILLAALD